MPGIHTDLEVLCKILRCANTVVGHEKFVDLPEKVAARKANRIAEGFGCDDNAVRCLQHTNGKADFSHSFFAPFFRQMCLSKFGIQNKFGVNTNLTHSTTKDAALSRKRR